MVLGCGLLFLACEKEDAVAKINLADQIDPAFSHAFLVTEDLPNSNRQLQHIQLTTHNAFGGKTLRGVAKRSVEFSFLHNGPLPAGTYQYRPGTDPRQETIDFFDLGYFEKLNFDEYSSKGSIHTPFAAVISVAYQGEEVSIEITTELSGEVVKLADYEGPLVPISTQDFPSHLELPSEGDASMVEVGDRPAFKPTYATLILPESAAENLDEFTGRLYLTTEPITRFHCLPLDDQESVSVSFRGRAATMGDGMLHVKDAGRGFSDNFGLKSHGVDIHLVDDSSSSGNNRYWGQGDLLMYLDGDQLYLKGEVLNCHPHLTIDITYAGSVRREVEAVN